MSVLTSCFAGHERPRPHPAARPCPAQAACPVSLETDAHGNWGLNANVQRLLDSLRTNPFCKMTLTTGKDCAASSHKEPP